MAETRMTSRERVKRAIEFKGPDRVPIYRVNIFKSDVMTYFTLPSKYWEPAEPYYPYVYDEVIRFGLWRPKRKLPRGWAKMRRDCIDDWRCIWDIDPGVSTRGCIKKGAIQEDWSLFDEFKPPDPRDHSRFRWCRYGWTRRLGRGRYRMGTEATFFFERFHFMRGFENFMTDLILYPEESGRLLDMIADYFIGLVETFHEYGMDGFATTDDLGTQLNAFISPEMFARFFTPRYKRVVDRCHELGMHFMLHSCGRVYKLIPELIKTGVDILQFDSPNMTGIEDVGKNFGGKVAFCNVVDIQEVLPRGNPDEIEAYVKKMIRHLGCYNGGLIGMQYADKWSIAVKGRYERMAWKAYDKWGRYPLAPELCAS
jgi:uroporphyrinogen decarboxylase